MEIPDRRKAMAEWARWARRALNVDAGAARRAAAAAMRAFEGGGDAIAASLAARQSAGRFGAAEMHELSAHRAWLSGLRAELAGQPPEGELTQAALSTLIGRIDRRLAVLRAIEEGGFATREYQAPDIAPAPAPGQPEASLPQPLPATAPPGPSLREFLAERSVLLVSYTGAFLLIVATILFETYAWKDLSGGLRFAGVLGLAVVFALAGWACYRIDRLRIVGETYIAIFALVTPLVFVAAYVFLQLGQNGITVDTALAATGMSCGLLYAVLAMRLGSRGYAALSLLALPVGLFGLADVLHLGLWRGLALAPLVGVYALIAHRSGRKAAGAYGPWAEPFVHGAALAALAVTAAVADPSGPGRAFLSPLAATAAVVAAGYTVQYRLINRSHPAYLALASLGIAALALVAALELGARGGPALAAATVAYLAFGASAGRLPAGWSRMAGAAGSLAHVLAATAVLWAFLAVWHPTENLVPSSWSLTQTLAVLTAAYGVIAVAGRRELAWVPGLTLGLAMVSALQAMRLDQTWFSVAFATLAVAYAVAPLRAGRKSQAFYEWAALVLMALVVLVQARPAGLQATLLLAGCAAFAWLARRRSEPGWLLAGTAAAAAAWYWLAMALLPPPAHARTGDLVTIYAPLPVVFGLVALGLRSRLNRSWSIPVYAAAAAVALAVTAGGLADGDLSVLGTALLAYAGLGYVGGLVEKQAWAVGAATVSAAGGVLAVLAGAAAPAWQVPPVISALAWFVYLMGVGWSTRPAWPAQWVEVHRYAGLTLAALTAVYSAAVPEFWGGGPGSLAGLAATWSLAVMLAVDSELNRKPALEYAAIAAAGFGGVWICRHLGIDNPQWQVLLPSLSLVGAGLRLSHDARLGPPRDLAWALTGAGATVLFGTSALQSLGDQPGLYTSLLVAQGVVALLLSIWARNRALALAGAAAIALSSVRAVLIALQTVPAFAVFGALALLLLCAGAGLALAREPAVRMRSSLARSWRDWS